MGWGSWLSLALAQSRNHRIVEVGRYFWEPSRSILLLKPGHLDLPAHDHTQMTFGCLQGWRIHHLYGQPVTITAKQCFLIFRENICGAFEMGSPDGKTCVWFGTVCVQVQTEVLVVVNERNITVHNLRVYSSSFNTWSIMPEVIPK